MIALTGKVKISMKELLEKQRKEFLKRLDRAIVGYERNITDPGVVFFCQRFLQNLVKDFPEDMGREIKRTKKVIMSYYETGNPYLAYQQCLSIKSKIRGKKEFN